jgi:predicted Zn-dependent protease
MKMTNDPFVARLSRIQSRAQADPEGALAELQEIVDEGIESVEAWILKASIHFESNDYQLAAEAFAKVLKRKPKSGIASVGRFHSLWSSGEQNAAFEEMKRYFREVGIASKSATALDYRAIVREINGDT